MPAKQPREQQKDVEQQKSVSLNALIGKQVMHVLGKPDGLHTVHVRRLWEDHYRVNVLIGQDVVSAKIANSYFVKVDGDGNLIESSPKLTKLY